MTTIVTASTSVPYDWLRLLPHSLVEKDEIPLLPSPGPFPWDKLSAFLTKTFQLEKLEMQPGQWESRSNDTLTTGLGRPLKYLNIELSPVEGKLTWAMAEKDIHLLMALILAKESRASDLIDKEYAQGFFEFIAMETLLSFNRSEYDKGLVPHLLDATPPPEDSSLCLDININCNGVFFIGRLILSETFRHSWKDRYTQHKMTIDMSPEFAQKLQVTVHLEAGSTELSVEEWKKARVGDYLLLDTCSFEPGTDKRRVMITLHGQTLFRAKVKQGNIKILESPLYHEVNTAMRNEDEDEETDEYFDESEIEESGEFNEDDDETEDEDFDLDETDLDETLDSDEHSAEHTAEYEADSLQSKTPIKKAAESAPPHPSRPENIKLNVIVEVGRIQMSIQKLMELQPGNLLELDVHPEDGVDLVVNGRCIARGELLRIGDTLGVRILDKG